MPASTAGGERLYPDREDAKYAFVHKEEEKWDTLDTDTILEAGQTKLSSKWNSMRRASMFAKTERAHQRTITTTIKHVERTVDA